MKNDIAYNHLNLPHSINNLADEYILLTYTADGEKLTKLAGGVTKNYVAGIEYAGANLEAIYHAEGRCVLISDTFRYEYTLKDHLGNARVNWRANGTAVTFLEELHYYPFGMLMEGIGTAAVTVNAYKYNSKELNTDLGLNWSDYGARWYDASVGRWWSVDPLAEKFNNITPYNYAVNNPVLMIDLFGMESKYYDDGSMYLEGADAQNYFRGLQARQKKNEEDKNKRKKDRNNKDSSSQGNKDDTHAEQPDDCCPEWMNRYLPIWSSGRDAYIDWENGDYGWAFFNGVMAVSDVFLVKSVFISGGKLLFKGALKTTGSHEWGATTRYWRETKKIEELTGGSKHHWGISREFMEKYPGLKPFGNQFPNIIKFKHESDHFRYGHGWSYQGVPGVGLLGRFWYGTPTWFKTTTFYGIDKIENKFRKD